MDTVTGIVLGAIFGSLFLFTCVISAVKAVRDRKRIKARIAERQREKSVNGTVTNRTESAIEENETAFVNETGLSGPRENSATCSNGHLVPGKPASISKIKNNQDDANSSYSSSSGIDNLTTQGVDNLTFERSFIDIPLADEIQEDNSEHCSESKVNPAFHATLEPHTVNIHVDKQTKSHIITKPVLTEKKHEHASVSTANETRRDRIKKSASSDCKDTRTVQINHLPPECLAVKKLLRRHSYEVAISDYSWVPSGPPSYASVVDKNDAHHHQYRQREKKYSLGLENRGFERRS